MRFFEPTTIEEAIRDLSVDPGHRCLAGGATLVAMLNAGLIEPTGLVSLANISEIRGITRSGDGKITIGAMTLHQTVADSNLFRGGHKLVRDAARKIGHPAIRNMGTIGGSISHADAAADYPVALVAADAAIEIAGPKGRRSLPANSFFVDYLETALTPGELVIGVTLPPNPGAFSGYKKFARVDGDFATVSVAAVLAMDGRKCREARIAIGGCGPTPVRVPKAEHRLARTSLDEALIAAYCDEVVTACDPIDDFRGTAEYRLMLVPVMVRRALALALARAEDRS